MRPLGNQLHLGNDRVGVLLVFFRRAISSLALIALRFQLFGS